MLLKISAVFLEFAAFWGLEWKLKAANYLGKTAESWGSELTGVLGWASTDSSGFSGTLMWAFATRIAGQRECCELQAPLPLSAPQSSAVCGHWLAGLFCFPMYQDQRLWLSGDHGCIWGWGLHASAWSKGGLCWCEGFAVSPFITPTMWMLSSVGTRVSVSGVSQGEQGLACFLTYLTVPLTECPVSVHTDVSFSELMIKAF